MAQMIPWLRHRLRSLIALLLTIGISLVVGALFETMTDEALLHKALILQFRTLEAASAFAPTELGERFLDALGADRGIDPSLDLRALTRSVLIAQHREDLAGEDYTPPRLAHWAEHFPAPLMPFVAIVDVVWHLFGSWSAWQVVVVAGELGIGLLLALLMLDEAGWYARIFLIPLATVGFGTLAALAGKWLMIIGLEAFGRVVSLAGLCCSTGGFVFAGYMLAMKHVEERVETFGHRLVERHASGERSGLTSAGKPSEGE